MLKDRRKNQAVSQYPGKTTVVANDAELRGNIRFTGAVQVDGRVIGNIDASDGLVSITQEGYVEGIIKAPKVIIDGVIVGDVYASEHLQLDAQARVDGDLYYRFMEMVTGAQINGQLQYLGDEQPSAEMYLTDEAELKSS
ncbi:MAG: polymer-forming cytoskeletal protein [Pseudomonas sp.]